jgi:hypothetical protein
MCVLILRDLEQGNPYAAFAADEMPDKVRMDAPSGSSQVTIWCRRRADE